MYRVIVVSNSEREIFCGKDGYVALDVSMRERQKTRLAVVLQTPSGKRYSMSQQDKMIRRLKMV